MSGTMIRPNTETAEYTAKAAFTENSVPVSRTQTEARAGPAISAKGRTEPMKRKERASAESMPPSAVLYVFSLIGLLPPLMLTGIPAPC